MAAAPPPSADGRLFAFLAQQRPLLADGAMGTILQMHAAQPSHLNLTNPELVARLHGDYARAGARMLVANTLTAAREMLGPEAAKAAEAGIRLARQSAGSHILVAGSLAAWPGRSHSSYREQIEAMAAADLLMIETVTSLAELDRALDAICGCRLPVLATLSFDTAGCLDGLPVAEVARRLQGRVAGLGYGCGLGLEASRPVLAELRAAAPEALIVAKPSLGLPPVAVASEAVERWARSVGELEVDVIGLCCGSTPAHIAAARVALGVVTGD